jgi:hypothetical protein
MPPAAPVHGSSKLTASVVPVALQNAEPWSLFNPAIHESYCAALRQMYQAASDSKR